MGVIPPKSVLTILTDNFSILTLQAHNPLTTSSLYARLVKENKPLKKSKLT